LAVWAVLRGVKLEIRGIGHLVYKESNRLEAITDNLKGIGIDCRILSKEKTTEKHDNLAPDAVLQILPTQAWVDHVQQRGREQRLKFRSFQDHRMVMAMSMLALPGWELEFDDAGVVTKSYPLFWEHWKILGYELTP
jgi:3-phosphoshikimate 1-carboxyvinyltransferase